MLICYEMIRQEPDVEKEYANKVILKQDRRNSGERIEALFRYDKVDRVSMGSLNPGFRVRNAGFEVASACDDREKNFIVIVWTLEQISTKRSRLRFSNFFCLKK